MRNTVNRDVASVSDKLASLLASARNLDASLDEATEDGSGCAADDVECKFRKIKSVLEGAAGVGSAATTVPNNTTKDGN